MRLRGREVLVRLEWLGGSGAEADNGLCFTGGGRDELTILFTNNFLIKFIED